ncbi:MAG: hypothetical protein F4Z55_16350 [Boseongicola sp. SB0667_bin_21]|nr:hypothetical protein [Boseongicola sp. SB0667_bin_21]
MRRMDIQDLERIPCPAVRLRFPNGNGRPQAPERPTIGPESGETDAGTGGAWREDGLGCLHGAEIRRHPVLIRPAVPSERRSCANGLWVWRILKPRNGVETVTADTFITRFMTHVLPDGFHRKTLDAARAALGVTAPEPEPHDPADSDESDETCGDEDAAESPACPQCGAPLRHLREIPAGQPGPARQSTVAAVVRAASPAPNPDFVTSAGPPAAPLSS